MLTSNLLESSTMACIDVYQPGRLLTVPLLVEQLWLRPRGKRLLVSEVYDFLLRVDDAEELSSFCVATPNFCRTRRKGEWKETVQLAPIGDIRTKWGWFYEGEQTPDDRQEHLSLRIPDPVNTTVEEDLEFCGLYLNDAPKIAWKREIAAETTIKLMREIKKSLYEVSFAPPLPGYGKEQRWFRLVVEPVLIDIDDPLCRPEQTFKDKWLPVVDLAGRITCPFGMRRSVAAKIGKLRTAHPASYADIDLVRRTLITRGYNSPGTSTRIFDHRLMLAGYGGVNIHLQGGSDDNSMVYYGTRFVECELPSYAHSYANSAEPKARWIGAIVHHWSGGSAKSPEKDLVSVANRYRTEAGYSAKQKTELVITTTPNLYREGCVLVDKMLEAKLLKMEETLCRPTDLEGEALNEALCCLRRLYLDPANFKDFPEARQAFTDLHPFSIDFSASWGTWPILRRMAVWIGFLVLVFTFLVSLSRVVPMLTTSNASNAKNRIESVELTSPAKASAGQEVPSDKK